MPSVATTKLTTAADLMTMPDERRRYELIEGVLREMPPAGGEHGEIETELIVHLRLHAAARGAGKVYPGDTGFFFQHDQEIVLLPDVAFVRAERLPPPAQRRGYLDLIPDLAVEIVSPADRLRQVRAKVQRYLAAGVRLVWLVEPRHRRVTVFRPGQPERVLGPDDELDGGDVLPGFRLPVAELFPE